MRTKYIAPILLALLTACSPTDPDSMSDTEPEAIDKPEPVAEPLVDIDLGEPEPFPEPEPEPEPESEAELMLIPADITVAVESLEGWRAPDTGRPFYVTTITVTLTWNMQEDHVYKLYVGEMLYHEDMRSGHEIIWEFLDRETEVQPENFPVVQIETCHKITLQCHLSEPIDVAPEFK